ncbi:hypothetical protein CMO93_04415 [Candidatus Woesearchaeota archaeon]|nr:hypothetical protein [Candidatus Woesearchaeota archaeon]|tara:strand:+ start:566 stop:913 length:348 start_codon:yes stop_codon:yes gene_type:complete
MSFKPSECASMIPYALAICPEVMQAYKLRQPVVLSYDRSPRRSKDAEVGTISVGIITDEEYKPLHEVMGLFGGDCEQVLSDQLSSVPRDMLGMLKLYVDGLEDPELKKELVASGN